MRHEPASVPPEPTAPASGCREVTETQATWFAAWVEQADTGVAVVDVDLRFLAANEALARIAAAPRDALVGRHLLDVFPDTPADLPPRLHAVLATGEPIKGLEIAVARAERGVRHWRVSYRRLDDPSGRPTLAIDVEETTSRKRAEERLHLLLEAKELLTIPLAFDVVLDRLARILVPELADWCAVDVLDEAGAFLPPAIAHVEPAKVAMAHELRRRYPMRPDDATGPMNVRRTGKAELFPEIPDELLAAGAHDEEHLRIVRALGVRSALVVPLRARGRVLGAITLVSTSPARRYDGDDLALAQAIADRAGLAIDNTRLFQAQEEARRRAEETARRVKRMQELAEALAGAAAPADVASVIARHIVQETAAKRVIVAMRGPDGRSLEIIGSLGHAPEVIDRYRRMALDAPLPVAVVHHARQPIYVESRAEYGARFPESQASADGAALAALPLVDPEGQVIGSVALGFDEARAFPDDERTFLQTLARQGAPALDRARLYEAERRARIAAEEANRSKDEFLGVVSHELRTPLNAIIGWSGLLEQRGADAAFLSRGLAVIARNARAQARIIDDILDVSRIVSGKLKIERAPIDLALVLGAAVEVVRPTAEAKGVTLAARMDDVPAIAGDPDRLQQVLWNLLANAVKFTPRGGRIDAVLGREDGAVRVTVADTGEGIDPAFLPFAFDRFRQADATMTRRHGGLGLGLAIVRYLVELHGGRVSAESAGLGQGARFSVWLPIPAILPSAGARSPFAADREPRTDLTAPSLEGLRVLVVDDELDTRDVVTAVLAERGAVVCAVGSADEALRALEDFAPHVLLSDLAMPAEDGFALLRRVRGLPAPLAATPAVALTAHARYEDASRALEAGFCAHLSKPVEPAKLCLVLSRIAAGLASA